MWRRHIHHQKKSGKIKSRHLTLVSNILAVGIIISKEVLHFFLGGGLHRVGLDLSEPNSSETFLLKRRACSPKVERAPWESWSFKEPENIRKPFKNKQRKKV